MITEFQDGFITKTKLNELVGGINANNEDISGLSSDLSNLIIEINAKVLTANVTKTVGSGGDFVTLNEAINWCKKVIPNGYEVELSLLSGFIWTENIVIENCDFGFVTISSVDSTVSQDTTDHTYAIRGERSIMPVWNILLIASTVNKSGMSLYYDSYVYIKNGKGVKNGFNNIILNGSKLKSDGTVLAGYDSGGVSYGRLEAYGNSDIACGVNCNSFTVAGGTYSGGDITANEIKFSANAKSTSYLTIRNLTNMYVPIEINRGSEVFISYVSTIGIDISLTFGGRCSIEGVSRGKIRHASANTGSYLSMYGMDLITISVSNGSIINANKCTGTLSQTANGITANGIIFK